MTSLALFCPYACTLSVLALAPSAEAGALDVLAASSLVAVPGAALLPSPGLFLASLFSAARCSRKVSKSCLHNG